MAEEIERSPRSEVLSHDFYMGPTELQLELVAKLEKLQARYAELLAANPLFKAAVHNWVEAEHDDAGTYQALTQFKMELDDEVDGMSEEERRLNPDKDLHKMVKLRLEIAELKIHIEASFNATGLNLDQYLSYAA